MGELPEPGRRDTLCTPDIPKVLHPDGSAARGCASGPNVISLRDLSPLVVRPGAERPWRVSRQPLTMGEGLQ